MHAPNLRKKLEISWTLRVQKAILTAKKKKKKSNHFNKNTSVIYLYMYVFNLQLLIHEQTKVKP